MNGMHRQRGVTLIELVIVTIIVGILAAIAIPSYRSYVLRSQRSDAKDAVLALVDDAHFVEIRRSIRRVAE
jgi:prepilin-type N-terminal cleavage/methylation domain-containing protein